MQQGQCVDVGGHRLRWPWVQKSTDVPCGDFQEYRCFIVFSTAMGDALVGAVSRAGKEKWAVFRPAFLGPSSERGGQCES